MPRGHLKHTVGVSKKVARGGASHSSQRNRSHRVQSKARQSYLRDDNTEEDCYFYQESLERDMCLELNESYTKSHVDAEPTTEKRAEAKKTNKDCPLCCEIRPLISLSKQCGQIHEPVCRECLRYMYVVQAQESVSNYPLRCFDINCRHPIRDTQLLKHNLVETEKELKRHYRLAALSKGHKGSHIKTVHCPHCDHPRTFTEHALNVKDRFFSCFQCKASYMVSIDAATIAAAEAFGNDKFGRNLGCAACPNCKVLISRGDGCDHTICILCRYSFSWEDARSRTKRYHNSKVANIFDWSTIEREITDAGEKDTQTMQAPNEVAPVLSSPPSESVPEPLLPLLQAGRILSGSEGVMVTQARELARQAVEAEGNGDMESALSLYRQAFSLDPPLEFLLAQNSWNL